MMIFLTVLFESDFKSHIAENNCFVTIKIHQNNAHIEEKRAVIHAIHHTMPVLAECDL